jgi:hypothetical protein
MAEPQPTTTDDTDSDLLEQGFNTGTEGEGFEDSAGGTE